MAQIFCRFSLWFKGIIVLVHTHEIISPTDNVIDVSIYAWKTWMWNRPCAKRVFTECLNIRMNLRFMANLVNCTQNPHHNLAKRSFYITQRINLNAVSFQNISAVQTKILGLIWNENWKRGWQRIQVQTIPWAHGLSGSFLPQRFLSTMEHILPDLIRDSSKRFVFVCLFFFFSVNSLSTIIQNACCFV